ncbi:MAG: peptide-methionine (R)-S-oxide reductase MsrB [Hyphomicrobiales bacterium]|nr:peptide-methionine (R)-S-oxide reductase MsrB [Hyphomicrobiales bacterium]MCY4032621.1 peptide-methionine (R)-S-oxide reductase MsrB [Hyphomicrobiales bacterium]MCY4039486.1 peptide-methionine (R)-S-oxide reductase MsrB [Hyphomicrobiales bacterium]
MTSNTPDTSGQPKSDSHWREALTPEAYHVTREAGTERPFTSALNAEKREGDYHCICCDTKLFSSGEKFDSGTGWPSFFAPVDASAINEKEDRKLFMRRTETLCTACDAHLGHVFPDGPPPTGLRYCINGVALRFYPKT